MISVIVPVYNAECWLRRCVDSILAQTFTDFELLLIDDGSTDASGVICNEYAKQDSRVRVFHKPNGGVSSARNLGLDNACGEWITFCDADDYVYPEWLQNYDIESVFDEDIVSQGMESDHEIFFTDKRSSKASFGYRGNIAEYVELNAAYRLFGFLMIKCFRAEVIKANGIRFDNCVKFQEDELFVTEFLKSATVAISVDKIGYYYFCSGWHRYKNSDIYNNYRNEKIVDNLNIIYHGNNESQFFRERQNNLIICLIREYRETKNKELLRNIRERIAADGFTRFPGLINRLIVADSTNFLLKTGIALISLCIK